MVRAEPKMVTDGPTCERISKESTNSAMMRKDAPRIFLGEWYGLITHVIEHLEPPPAAAQAAMHRPPNAICLEVQRVSRSAAGRRYCCAAPKANNGRCLAGGVCSLSHDSASLRASGGLDSPGRADRIASADAGEICGASPAEVRKRLLKPALPIRQRLVRHSRKTEVQTAGG